jgi:uncharacterized protein
MKGDLKVVGLTASRGQKVEGSIKAGELASHDVEIPVILVAGKEDGQTLSITAGMHATEYVGIVAAYQIARKVDPSKLKGNLVIAPLLNRYGFDALSLRINPVDGANLNRIFPGDAEGTISYQIADQVFRNVISVSDCYIDFHGGELFESLIPLIICYDTGDASLFDKTMQLVRAFALKYVYHGPDPSAPQNEGTGFAIVQAAMKGIPAFAAEAGTEAKLDDESVDILVQGTFNVMRAMGMIDDGSKTESPEPIVSRKEKYLTVGKSGLLYSFVKVGDQVAKGQKLIEVRTLSGDVLETIYAPDHAVILTMKTNPVVKKGDYFSLILQLS